MEDQADLCFTSVRQATSSREKIYLLHRHSGHPSFALMKDYFPTLLSGMNAKTLTCEACQLAKHRCSSFKLLNVRCLRSFECVHSYVRGPCSIPSVGGNM